ncbi:MAG: hypothetical protein A2901_05795 [Elusimicrobia bacterium RIFCSPLOWO2_01_FULL_54_10]|nr:MAG: hypothetical protein A2901_05795 [Elusimicrobia bacterium RIFCSPLOWO2_01_FULL_54_10]
MSEKAKPQDKQILVIDDDESICMYLKALFELEGFKVEFMNNGEDGVAFVDKNKVDMIILDWMMPILSGFEVLKLLQKDDHKGIPVVVITARVTDDSTADMIRNEMNVVGFVPKPIKHDELITLVHETLDTIPRQRKDSTAS